jgi:hypothetical protein
VFNSFTGVGFCCQLSVIGTLIAAVRLLVSTGISMLCWRRPLCTTMGSRSSAQLFLYIVCVRAALHLRPSLINN